MTIDDGESNLRDGIMEYWSVFLTLGESRHL